MIGVRSTDPKPITVGLSLFALGATFLVDVGRGALYANSFVENLADGRYRIYFVLVVCMLLVAISRVGKP